MTEEMKEENKERGAARSVRARRHLAVLVVDSEGHAGRRQQEQRLLLRQLLPEPLDDL